MKIKFTYIELGIPLTPTLIATGKPELPSKDRVVIHRKFVVIVDESGEITIVLGGIWEPGGYKHEYLLRGDERKLASGGGLIEFTGVKVGFLCTWSAKVHESSIKFGPFDPRILMPENCQAIATSLMMTTKFEWQQTVRL